MNYNDEGSFDCMTCTLDELAAAIESTTGERRSFLLGIQHARTIISAATGGAIQPAAQFNK